MTCWSGSGWASTSSTARSRHGSPDTGRRSRQIPSGRFRIDLTKAAYADDDSPVVEGCPCEACTRHSRAYLHYLARNKDLTGTRLLTLHNLIYMERLVGRRPRGDRR